MRYLARWALSSEIIVGIKLALTRFFGRFVSMFYSVVLFCTKNEKKNEKKIFLILFNDYQYSSKNLEFVFFKRLFFVSCIFFFFLQSRPVVLLCMVNE